MGIEFSEQEKQSFYKAIFSRRDVRTKYTSKEISNKKLIRILQAAHHAPSVGFSQPWNFLLIKNPTTKAKIKNSFNEERLRSSQLVTEPRRSKYLSYKLEAIMEAPINICVTYDPKKFGSFIIGKSSIPETGVYSVCCAIQNLWLAARAEGLGLGWVSILSNQMLQEVLGLPEHVTPVAYLCLGYPESFATKPDLEQSGWLPRLALQDVIYFEHWEQTSNVNWQSFKDSY